MSLLVLAAGVLAVLGFLAMTQPPAATVKIRIRRGK